jgi:hypothetical protein
MKISVLVIATLFLFSPKLLQAQEPKEKIHNKYRHEVTFLGRNFDEVGLGYRIGNEKALWRISATARANQFERIDSGLHVNTIGSAAIGLEIGREYRFEVAENLFLRIGGDLFYEYAAFINEPGDDVSSTFKMNTYENEYGVKIVTGFLYQVNKNIHFGFELLPYFSFSTRNNEWGRWGNSFRRSTNIRFDKSVFRFNAGFNF